MQNFAEIKILVLRYCTKCIEMEQKFCEVCAHFFAQSWYYNNRKNPNTLYIVLLYPIVKIPSPKRAASDGCSFFVMEKSSSEEREIDRSIELR